jgi:hypothetical protein
MADEPVSRVATAPVAALRASIEACTAAVSERLDPLDYRSWSVYLERAGAAFAVGEPISAVVEDLYLAARCLHGNEAIHLGKHEPRQFLTRRVHPVELALASGHPVLMAELTAAYGLSIPLVMSRSDAELDDEIAVLTSHFMRQRCTDHRALLGLGGVVFAGSLAALARGFDDEAALGLETYGDARRALAGVTPPDALLGKLRRYDALNLALVDIVNRQAAPLGERIAKLVSAHERELSSAEGGASKTKQGWLDTSAVALVAAATWRELAVELPSEHPYQGFVVCFGEGPRADVLAEKTELPPEILARLSGAAPGSPTEEERPEP